MLGYSGSISCLVSFSIGVPESFPVSDGCEVWIFSTIVSGFAGGGIEIILERVRASSGSKVWISSPMFAVMSNV